MNRRDTIQMMARCKDEIQEQRNQIERLSPKAEAYDLIKQILGLLPKQSQGYGEDIVYKLERAIIEEAKAENEEQQAKVEAMLAEEKAAEDGPNVSQ